MKKFVFCLLLFIWALKTYSQDKDYFSTEIDANYYYYCSLGESRNKFNYGFSILISKYISSLKVSSGLNYATKFYYYDVTPIFTTNYLNKRDYKATYLNIPITSNIEMISRKSFSSSVLIGFAFNRIINYSIQSYYLYNGTTTDRIPVQNQNFGTTLICGTTISKSLNNKYVLNLSPFLNYILISDLDNQRPDYRNLPDDKISVGFKIGIEYLFKESDNE